jgi:hypothetical protein
MEVKSVREGERLHEENGGHQWEFLRKKIVLTFHDVLNRKN